MNEDSIDEVVEVVVEVVDDEVVVEDEENADALLILSAIMLNGELDMDIELLRPALVASELRLASVALSIRASASCASLTLSEVEVEVTSPSTAALVVDIAAGEEDDRMFKLGMDVELGPS